MPASRYTGSNQRRAEVRGWNDQPDRWDGNGSYLFVVGSRRIHIRTAESSTLQCHCRYGRGLFGHNNCRDLYVESWINHSRRSFKAGDTGGDSARESVFWSDRYYRQRELTCGFCLEVDDYQRFHHIRSGNGITRLFSGNGWTDRSQCDRDDRVRL